MGFIKYFNDKLLEADAEIADMVYKEALKSYKNRKVSKEYKQLKSKMSIFDIPNELRDLGIKIKHFKPQDDMVEIQLFNSDSLLAVTKFLKHNGIKNFSIEETELKVIIKG